MADGAGFDAIMQQLLGAVVNLTGEFRELRGEVKGLIDQDALQREVTQLRAEMERRDAELEARLDKRSDSRWAAMLDRISDENLQPRVEKQATAVTKSVLDEDHRISQRSRVALMAGGGAGLLGGGYALLKSFSGG